MTNATTIEQIEADNRFHAPYDKATQWRGWTTSTGA